MLGTVPLEAELADVVRQLMAGEVRVLVGVDGPDCAGKTSLADRLARELGPGTHRASVVPPEITLRRALDRDAERFGSREEVERRYRRRYLPAQELYRAHARPEDRADVVVDNADPESPVVLEWRC
jgi:thymidylate kinase